MKARYKTPDTRYIVKQLYLKSRWRSIVSGLLRHVGVSFSAYKVVTINQRAVAVNGSTDQQVTLPEHNLTITLTFPQEGTMRATTSSRTYKGKEILGYNLRIDRTILD